MIALEREQFLKRLALFGDLDAGELRELAEACRYAALKRGVNERTMGFSAHSRPGPLEG
jgi:hypothetical protein